MVTAAPPKDGGGTRDPAAVVVQSSRYTRIAACITRWWSVTVGHLPRLELEGWA
jgi:hypothetical protein